MLIDETMKKLDYLEVTGTSRGRGRPRKRIEIVRNFTDKIVLDQIE